MIEAPEQYTPEQYPPVPAPAKKNWFLRHKIVTGIAVLVALGMAAGGPDDTAVPAPNPVTSEPVAVIDPPESEASKPLAPMKLVDPDAETRLQCIHRTSVLSDILSDLAKMDPTTKAEVRGIVNTGKAAIAEGRSIVKDCGHLADPTDVNTSLDKLEALMDLLETTL